MAASGRTETRAVPISTTAIAAEHSLIAAKRRTVPDPKQKSRSAQSGHCRASPGILDLVMGVA